MQGIALASGNAALDKGIYTSEWIIGANGSADYTFTGPGFSGGEKRSFNHFGTGSTV